jgi:hypothetical protein
MQRVMADRLIDLCERHADEIAEQWHSALSANPRTTSCNLMSKAGALRHATSIYKNLGKMYLAENCYQAVEHVLDANGFAEDFYARGIPPEEVIYALVLMRRHIWLHAETQALYEMALNDMFEAVTNINRVLLIFDYASYIISHRYRELAAKTRK